MNIGRQRNQVSIGKPQVRKTATRFIPARVTDNSFINSDYVGMLEDFTGWKREAWLNGNCAPVFHSFASNRNSKIKNRKSRSHSCFAAIASQ